MAALRSALDRLYLAAGALTARLPPTLKFGRELGKLYMTALCARTERL